MNDLYFTPLSLSQLLKEKGVNVDSLYIYLDPIPMLAEKGITKPIIREWLNKWKEDKTEDLNRLIDKQTISAYSLSELPDVFRQIWNGRDGMYGTWEDFCSEYFTDRKIAWDNLEKTIRSL